MKSPLVALTLALLGGTLLGGCSSDVEVNAPYKNITVMYGLLSKNDSGDVHILKINKAFLGNGNMYTYASVPDSTVYADADLNAWVEKLSPTGQVLETYPVESFMADGRDPGVFSGPQHKMYRFTAALDSTLTYRVVLDAKGERCSATTAIARAPGLSVAMVNPTSLRINLHNGTSYLNYNIGFTSGANGRRHEVSYRFRWRELNAAGDTSAEKSFDQLIGSAIADNLNGGQPMTVALGGEGFFRTVAEKVPATPGVVRRIVTGMDLTWAVAGSDLSTYIQLTNPVSGVLEDRPEFSNVDGGYGLVSSRRHREVIDKMIQGGTRTELRYGPHTAHLNFCWPSGEEDCPN